MITYQGTLLEARENGWTVEATFQRADQKLDRLQLRAGDRFVEHFFSDRWYNVFEIYDRESGLLKAWYCNIARPARFTGSALYQDDLALDLLVYPDGGMTVLDREEFEALDLPLDQRARALDALDRLQGEARSGGWPFQRSEGSP